MLDALAPPPAVAARDGQTHAFIPSPSWTLAETAEAILTATFDKRGHYPSADHWNALRDILATIQSMADGTAEPSVFLASLCPGLGKSSAIVAAATALSTLERYDGVGMLVAVGRLAEARALVGEMRSAGIGHTVAVRTSDAETNAMSGCLPDDAAVLVVTQQSLELLTKRRPFNDVSALFFKGRPRACKAWDELWEPGLSLTLERDDISGLLVPARQVSYDFRNALEDLHSQLVVSDHDAVLAVPDWEEQFGVSEQDLLAQAQGKRQSEAATALFALSGRAIRVHRENYAKGGQGRVFVAYKETHPADFSPLLVLDASIRVKQTYRDAITFRDVTPLRSAVKDYSPLAVHLWTTAASKTGWNANGDALLDGIVSTIAKKPNERWLVVGHKQMRRGVDVPKQILRSLPPSMTDRVSFLSWGMHFATNQFRDYENVLLASTYFLPALAYTALTHMARGQHPEIHGFADVDAIRETTWGEHRHNIVQAACRGRCRQSDGDRCAPMDLYVIAAASSGIPRAETIQQMFPGARTVRWCPIPPKLRGRAVDAATALDSLMTADKRLTDPDDFLSYGKLVETMKAADPRSASLRPDNFIERVAKRDDWQNHIVALGLAEATAPNPRGGRPLVGLRVASGDDAAERFDDDGQI